MTTTEDCYKAAVRFVRAAGVTVRLNVPSATRGSTTLVQLGIPDWTSTPYAWTWAGQGNRVRWVDGEMYSGDGFERYWRQTRDRQGLRTAARLAQYRAKDVCWYHGGPGIDAARVVADAFKAEGFEVDWDGTEHKAVTVKLPTP